MNDLSFAQCVVRHFLGNTTENVMRAYTARRRNSSAEAKLCHSLTECGVVAGDLLEQMPWVDTLGLKQVGCA